MYLKRAGIDLSPSFGFSNLADTQGLHQHWVQASQPTSLAAVLGQLGIKYRNLHNAGNDATYTLQAAVALAFTEPPRLEEGNESSLVLELA